jgi:NIPSNAP
VDCTGKGTLARRRIIVQRRQFLVASLAASALATVRSAVAQSAAPHAREFYQIRQYKLENGPQTKLVTSYFSDALIPALTRMGFGPIGAFSLDIGPETPTYYLVIPGASAEALVTADLHLAEDADFLKAGDAFWNAPASSPSFQRVDSSLLIAFEGWPKLTPTPTGTSSKRVFQMRTYESPTYRDHVNKVEMFHKGEFEIFKAAGLHSVFYGDTLIGPRIPALTYMLRLDSLDEMNAKWDAFRNHPDWKKLSSDPKYSFEPTVSNITNLVLSPLGCSQI